MERIEHGRQLFNWPVLRKKDVQVTAEDLARPSDDPREVVALRHNLKQVQRELEMALSEGEEHTQETRAEFENSLSWRATKPLRATRQLLRRRSSDGDSAPPS